MIRTSLALFIGSIVTFLIAIISFLGGWALSQATGHTSMGTFVTTTLTGNGDSAASAQASDSFKIFWEVWDLVDREFYHTEPLDQQQMVYGAIRGMLGSLNDDYTMFQEPEVAERAQESLQGRFEGIGVYIHVTEGEIIINRPIKGSPAMKAGLQNNDVIVGVDGQQIAPIIEGLAEDEAVNAVAELIRGPRGSEVTVTIRRPATGETFDVDIVRDEVPLISVYWQMMEDDIAYIQITEFKATTTAELDEALRDLLPQQPSGLVLDLRDNPGGFLKTAQEVLGRFYEGIALYEELGDGSTREMTTIQAPEDVRAYDIPLVVVFNEYSASASEIVAGALRDERPATTLLGQTSFGKGSVQNIHRLSDGSSVRITIAHWFTPDSHQIDGVGVPPDFVIAPSQNPEFAVPCTELRQTIEGLSECRDAQLAWALRLLQEEAEIVPAPPRTPALQ